MNTPSENLEVGATQALSFWRKPSRCASNGSAATEILYCGLSLAETRCLEYRRHPTAHGTVGATANGKTYTNTDALPTWQVKKLVWFLETEAKPTLTVKELASSIHISRSHFTRLFKSTFGVSPAAFLTKRRMEQAIWIVSHTQIRLTDVAAHLGFSDQSHFSRSFKEWTGVNPSRWRSAAKDLNLEIQAPPWVKLSMEIDVKTNTNQISRRLLAPQLVRTHQKGNQYDQHTPTVVGYK
jgi:AraC-like DNA-binding protein